MTSAIPKSSRSITKSLLAFMASGLIVFSLESTAATIDANTNYGSSDFSGQSLTASALDLGTASFGNNTNVSNTTWTNTPHFSALPNQGFRLVNFTGANWSGLSFTAVAASNANQFFQQTDLTNANFSNTILNLVTTNNNSETFNQSNLSGADFSGSYLNVGTNNGLFVNSTFSSTTDFSGSTIISGINSLATSLGGADFSNATLRLDVNGADLSDVSFQNTTFVASDGIQSVVRNSVANGTDFRGTDFTGIGFANWLPSLTWTTTAPIYDENTIFTTQNGTFDPVAGGWALIPEPSTLTLLGISEWGFSCSVAGATAGVDRSPLGIVGMVFKPYWLS